MATLVERLQIELSKLGSKNNKLNQALYSSWYSPFTPITAPTNYTTDLVRGYMDSEAIYSIVNKIANTASSVPLELVNEAGDVVENHWSLEVLKEPNDDNTYKELIFNYYVYLLSIGNSFMYAPKIDRGETLELWNMPSDIVEVISGRFNEPVVGYKMMEGNQEIVFPKEQVLHGKLFNPRFLGGSWVYGLSPISVAEEIIKGLEAGNNSTVASFVNGGPAFIVSSTSPEGLTPEQQELLETTYKKKFSGADNKNKHMLSGTPLDVKTLGLSPIDLNIINNSKYSWQVLCNVYGVSSVLFNDNESSTYNNVSSAYKAFYQHTIQPLNEQFAAKLTQFLVKGEGLSFRFNYDNIEVLQEAFFTQSEAMNNIWYLTPNEKRERLGLATLPDPLMDEVYKPVNVEELGALGAENIAQEEFIKTIPDGN